MGAFVLKSYTVTVDGYGQAVYYAKSRGSAMAQAWRCDAFCQWSFKTFLQRARCHKDTDWRAEYGFGDPIEVCGKPAFFVTSNRQYVQFVRADSDLIMSAHPLEVKPIEYRPDTYRSEKFDAL